MKNVYITNVVNDISYDINSKITSRGINETSRIFFQSYERRYWVSIRVYDIIFCLSQIVNI